MIRVIIWFLLLDTICSSMTLTSTLTFALTSPVISRVDVRDSTWGGLECRCSLKMVKEHTGSLLERTISFGFGIDLGLD